MTSFLKKNSWTIDLSKVPAYSCWNGDWKYAIDKDIIQLILDCDEIDSNGEKLITDIMKTHFKRNIVDKLRKGFLHINWSARYGNLGRRYSSKDPTDTGAFSSAGNLGVHSKRIKNTIFKFMGWIDYDMVKGHPSILLSMARITGLTDGLPAIQRFVSEFDSGLADEMIEWYSIDGQPKLTKDDIKDLHNRTIYGGGHSTWIQCLLAGDEKKGKLPKEVNMSKGKHPKYIEFKRDICRVIDLVYSQNPDLLARVVGTEDLPEWKKKGRVMSYFCGIIENDILACAYKYGVKNNLFPAKSIDLCFDGFTTPPPPFGTDIDFHIAQMNDTILRETGFDVKMKVKPFTNIMQSIIDKRIANEIPTIDIEDSGIHICETDTAACDVVLSLLGDNIFADRSRIFIKCGNVWCCNPDIVNCALHNFIKRCHIYRGYSKTNTLIPFVQNLSGLTSVLAFVKNEIKMNKQDPARVDLFRFSTKNKLCFLDGVFDFKLGTFEYWDSLSSPVYTTIVIKRNFGEYFKNPDEAMISEVKTKIYDSLYGSERDRALHFLSRAITGNNQDKSWGMYVGNRDCGKGIQYDNLKYAFGDYVSTFNLSNVTRSRITMSVEDSKSFYWLLALEHTRLAIAQETPSSDSGIHLNGALIKKICGGGDPFAARGLYQTEDTILNLVLTPYILGNNSLESDVKDVMEHCSTFSSSVQYWPQEKIDAQRALEGENFLESAYRVGDNTLKDKCKNEAFMNATVMLLYRAWVDSPVPVKIDEDELAEINLRAMILRHYDVTKDENHMVLPEDIMSCIGITDKKKIKLEILAMLGSMDEKKKYKKCKTAMFKDKWVFCGLKSKVCCAEGDDDC